MKISRRTLCLAITLLLTSSGSAATRDPKPVRNVTDPGVNVTRQNTTPAGAQSVFEGRVYGVAFGANQEEIWVLGAKEVVALSWRENRVIATIPLEGKPG